MDFSLATGSFPLLPIMVALPAVVALILWVVPPLRASGRIIALVTSFVELGLAIWLAIGFDWATAARFQWGVSVAWIEPLGVSWSMGVNALGVVMIVLTAVLIPLVLLSTPKGNASSEGGYAALILGLYAFIVVIFGAFDLVLFYLAFEGMLVPLYFMIGRYGNGENRTRAAMKFLIYSLVGGLVMLGGLVTIFGMASSTSDGILFRYDNLANILPSAPYGLQVAVFVTFFIAFAIKAPMVPVHTWLPDVAAEARPGTSVILVGILDKIGTFGMIVFCLAMTPEVSYNARWVIMALAVFSILWGGFAANGQKNLLRLVSFTSVSHFGFMILGIFAFSEVALTGSMFYMVAHGLSIAGLFLISGFLIERGGSAQISHYRGWQRVTPVLAGTWLFAGLASIALPGLSGFVPEFLVLMGTYQVSPALAIIAVFGVVLAALYILLPYQKMFTGPVPPEAGSVPDLNWLQKFIVAPLMVLMILLGIWSAPVVGPLEQVSSQAVGQTAFVLDLSEGQIEIEGGN